MLRSTLIAALIALQAAPLALPGMQACFGSEGGVAIEAAHGRCQCGGHAHDEPPPAAAECCPHEEAAAAAMAVPPTNLEGLAPPCDCAHVALLGDAAVATAAKAAEAAGPNGMSLLPAPVEVAAVDARRPGAGGPLEERPSGVPAPGYLCARLRC